MKPEKEHKSKRKKEKKSSKKRRSQKKLLSQLKLISLAELGDVNKVEEFLASQGDEAVSLYDSEGSTPLHQVMHGVDEVWHIVKSMHLFINACLVAI